MVFRCPFVEFLLAAFAEIDIEEAGPFGLRLSGSGDI